jgi:hypothetical protein
LSSHSCCALWHSSALTPTAAGSAPSPCRKAGQDSFTIMGWGHNCLLLGAKPGSYGTLEGGVHACMQSGKPKACLTALSRAKLCQFGTADSTGVHACRQVCRQVCRHVCRQVKYCALNKQNARRQHPGTACHDASMHAATMWHTESCTHLKSPVQPAPLPCDVRTTQTSSCIPASDILFEPLCLGDVAAGKAGMGCEGICQLTTGGAVEALAVAHI